MQYSGGKHRLKNFLSREILPICDGREIIEPFCGALNATCALMPKRASDASKPLIDMILAIRGGWTPPDFVSEEDYELAKNSGTPMEGFCGFGCSWGGKFFGGYARGYKGRNYALGSKRSILKKVKETMSVDISLREYHDIPIGSGQAFYCDPPYSGTTSGYTSSTFDSDEFWEWCRYVNKKNNLVFVSEFSAPDDIEVLSTFEKRQDMRSKCGQRPTEKLFILR